MQEVFINWLSKFLVIIFMGAAMLFSGAAAQAMTFPQFDHMSNQDRLDYRAFMVDSAHKVLVEEGRTADANKMYHLFNDVAPGSVLPLGEAEFELNLANERVHAAQKVIENPNAPPVQVEAALVLTLMKNGIQITPDFVRGFFEEARTFKPLSSKKGKKATKSKKDAKKAN